jgi:hypothetical protein
LLDGATELFEVERGVERARLIDAFGSPEDGGRGRFGLWTAGEGAILAARRHAFRPFLPAGGEALRGLDVTLLGVALERLVGLDAGAIAGGAIGYTKSAREAVAAVDDGSEFEAAFLLEGTPVADIVAVARDGDVMPQKSTYFYPKALTGLVINPHEW